MEVVYTRTFISVVIMISNAVCDSVQARRILCIHESKRKFKHFPLVFNLVVCILLRVVDQVLGFPSNATLFE
jgi:hypothetical protein